MERGEKGPLCDPGSLLLLGGSARVHSASMINGMKKKEKRTMHTSKYVQNAMTGVSRSFCKGECPPLVDFTADVFENSCVKQKHDYLKE